MGVFDELNLPGALQQGAITQAAAGTLVLIAAAAGKVASLMGVELALTVAGTVQFQDTTGVALSGIINLAAGTPLVLPICNAPWFTAVIGRGIQIVSTTGGANGSFVGIQGN